MADLKQPATKEDAKKLLESALGGKTVKSMLDAAGFFKGMVEPKVNEVINVIAATVNDPNNKDSSSIIAALKSNKTITENLKGLNENKDKVGLEQEVQVDEISTTLGDFLKLNAKSVESPAKVAAAGQGAKNDKKVDATKSNSSKAPAVAPTPTQTASQKSEEIAAAEAASADKKAKEDKAKAEEKNKNPLMEFLKNIPIIGPIIAMIMGAGGDKKESDTQVASSTSAPSANGDVALSSLAPSVPAQGQSKNADILPPVVTPNQPVKAAGRTT